MPALSDHSPSPAATAASDAAFAQRLRDQVVAVDTAGGSRALTAGRRMAIAQLERRAAAQRERGAVVPPRRARWEQS